MADQLRELVERTHADIEAALRRAEAASATAVVRDFISSYDEAMRELAVHLVGMEVAVVPVVRRQLPRGPRLARRHMRRTRDLEMTMRLIEQELWGDVYAPSAPLDALHAQLVEQMVAHRREEEDMLTALPSALTREQLASLAERLDLAVQHAPTRPHPHAVLQVGSTRLLYRAAALWDRVLDTLDSRPAPRRTSTTPEQREPAAH